LNRVKATDVAGRIAEELLAPLGDRWLHVQSVVKLARNISGVLGVTDRTYLISAAYLHDIGYAPSLQDTGFHPIDGARLVLKLGDPRLASLVAHHSGARFEAELLGLGDQLAQFPREHSAVADALDYCDALTGPTGKRVSLHERGQDIRDRYGDDHIVTQAYRRALPSLVLSVGRTRLRLRQHGILEPTSPISK